MLFKNLKIKFKNFQFPKTALGKIISFYPPKSFNSNLHHISYKTFSTYGTGSNYRDNSSYNNSKKSIDYNTINEILNLCKLEPRIQSNYIKAKYCPLCEKPHNEEATNLYTFLIYKESHIYYCFRCGNKGSFMRLFKVLSKMADLSKYSDAVLGKGHGYSSNGGNTTENDEFQTECKKNLIDDENVVGVNDNIRNSNNDFPDDSNANRTVNNFKSSSNNSNNTYTNYQAGNKENWSNIPKNMNNNANDNFKISLNITGLVNELYRRNLLVSNQKCSIILDYLTNERKLKTETLQFYNVGVSYEKFKSNSYDYINLPCVTYPMFYPTDKNSFLALEKGIVEDSLYDFYKLEKFFLARLKVRAIGKEFKHFQRIEPSGAVLWGLFGLDTVPLNAEEIIITEGEYDAMAAYQELGIPSISLPNGASNLPTQVLPYFKRFKRIYLWMDADQAGQVAAENFSNKLGENKTLIINTRREDPLGPKDANDALREGKDFSQYIKQAKPLSGDTIIKMGDIKSEIIQFLSQYEHYSGYKATSMPFFNKKLKGLRMGEFSILTGETGSGKTTFLAQLSLDFISQGVPTLWGSFEIKNDKLASMFLMQYARKNLRLSQVPEIEYYTEIFEKLPLYMLKFHGSQNIDEVINSMNFAVYNYDIQNIILDNLQFMIGSPSKFTNKFDYQDEIIHRLRKFATEKNVHVTLVIHPRKDDILKISSIFGTGKASQEADNIYILQSYKGLRILEIAKNRFDGTVGKAALAFDNNSCRFFELNLEEFSKIVKSNYKLEDVIKDRISKYGSIEYETENGMESLRDMDMGNKKLAEDSSMLDAFVTQKEKEMNQFNKDQRVSKDITLEIDMRELFPAETRVNTNNTDNRSKSNSNSKDYINNEEEFELSSKILEELKNELSSIENNESHNSVKSQSNNLLMNENNYKNSNQNSNVSNPNSVKNDNNYKFIQTNIPETRKDLVSENINVIIKEKIPETIQKVINEIIPQIITNKINTHETSKKISSEPKPEIKITVLENTVMENIKIESINKNIEMLNIKIAKNSVYNTAFEPHSEDQSNEVALHDIKKFQTQIFPKIKVIDTFHTHQSQEKTQSNSHSFKPKSYNNYQRVKQSTYKVPRDSLIDDIF